MGIFSKKLVETTDVPKLPEGIIAVECGDKTCYQVEGRVSAHVSVEKALKQLEGMKNDISR